MKFVEPIKDEKMIEEMKKELKKHKSLRDYLLFVIGVSTGLRISDIVALKLSDVFNDDYSVKKEFTVKEQKTGKTKYIYINDSLKIALIDYLSELKENNSMISKDEYIIKSQKAGQMSRIQAYTILKSAAEKVGIKNFGCHSLRKTFGYLLYTKTNNLGLTCKMLNHSSIGTTLRYIGIQQMDMEEAFQTIAI